MLIKSPCCNIFMIIFVLIGSKCAFLRWRGRMSIRSATRRIAAQRGEAHDAAQRCAARRNAAQRKAARSSLRRSLPGAISQTDESPSGQMGSTSHPNNAKIDIGLGWVIFVGFPKEILQICACCRTIEICRILSGKPTNMTHPSPISIFASLGCDMDPIWPDRG